MSQAGRCRGYIQQGGLGPEAAWQAEQPLHGQASLWERHSTSQEEVLLKKVRAQRASERGRAVMSVALG